MGMDKVTPEQLLTGADLAAFKDLPSLAVARSIIMDTADEWQELATLCSDMAQLHREAAAEDAAEKGHYCNLGLFGHYFLKSAEAKLAFLDTLFMQNLFLHGVHHIHDTDEEVCRAELKEVIKLKPEYDQQFGKLMSQGIQLAAADTEMEEARQEWKESK